MAVNASDTLDRGRAVDQLVPKTLVIALAMAYGSNWQHVTGLEPGRYAKLGLQVTF